MRSLAIGILAAYLPGLFGGSTGIRLSYLGWIVPLVGAAIYVLVNAQRVRFPLWIWIPWSAMVAIYVSVATSADAPQRAAMLLTPLVVGAAFSALTIDRALLTLAEQWVNKFTWLFVLVAAVATGLLAGGRIYATSNFAAGSITASLLASWYGVRFVTSERLRSFAIWLTLAVIPVLANARTGMIAVAVSLPFTFAPWPWMRRLFASACLIGVGVLVFQSDHVQSKMFSSGHGSIEDAVDGIRALFVADELGGDFTTSGRTAMARVLRAGLGDAYWLGHGANTTEAISIAVAGVAHPHNDWLRIQYEYGMTGLLIFASSIFAQCWHALRRAREIEWRARMFLFAGAGAFLPMAMFMFSDNVILYAAWFGNLQFAMLGIGYAARRGTASTA